MRIQKLAATSLAKKRQANYRRLLIVALVFLVIACFGKSLAWMWERWTADPDYSHGPLVPLICAFLIWRERETLKTLPKHSSLAGIYAVLAGLFLHVASVRADVHFLSMYAFIIVIFGLALHLWGPDVTKRISFSLAFLLFMVPFFQFLIDPITNKLKILASLCSAVLVEAAGFAVVREGVMLHLPSTSLEVADSCSGLRSLIAVASLGALFAYLADLSLTRKVLLFLSFVPFAVLGNIVRVSALCILAEGFGLRVEQGFLHTVLGFLGLGVALAGMLMTWSLLKWSRRGSGTPV